MAHRSAAQKFTVEDRRRLSPDLARPAPRRAPAVPLCISFTYRDRRVLCAPLWTDAGDVVAPVFDCPRCHQVMQIGGPESVLWVPPTGRLFVERWVRCRTPGCCFTVEIRNGRAEDVVGGVA